MFAREDPPFLFRVDASPEIGLGHFSRCLVLADQIQELGGSCTFLSSVITDVARQRLEAQGHRLELTGQEVANESAEAVINALPHPYWSGIILDHYDLDEHWEQVALRYTDRLLVIDDRDRQPHSCHTLLDQNYRREEVHESRRSQYPGALLLLGPRFALIAPAFRQLREMNLEPAAAPRLLICFGGTDPMGLSSRALRAIRGQLDPEVRIEVATTSANPGLRDLQDYCESDAQLRLHVDAPDMASLMAGSTVVLGAGGVMHWEWACLGIPAIVITAADNQRLINEDLAHEGRILYLGDATQVTEQAIRHAVCLLLGNSALRDHLSRLAQALVDGRGAERVLRHWLEPTLRMRRAKIQDSEMILAWRNSEAVRANSKNSAEIPEEQHRDWFSRAVSDPGRILLIAEHDGDPVGLVRYDIDSDRARVSVFMDPGRIGCGLGSTMLRQGSDWLAGHDPRIREIRAEILPTNHRSQAAFERAGYKKFLYEYRKDMGGSNA